LQIKSLQLANPAADGFGNMGGVVSPFLCHTPLGACRSTVSGVVAKEAVGSHMDPCLTALFPDKEGKDSDQAKALRGGLPPLGDMKNGYTTGC
jgi:hypothetical protein